MPRKPRTRRQSTLAFAAASKVSKPALKPTKTFAKAPARAEVEAPPKASQTPQSSDKNTPLAPPLLTEIPLTSSEVLEPYFKSEESVARSLPSSQVNKYYNSIQSARKAPPVHRSNVPQHEQILRHFDLSSQYGPCIGLLRLNRWKRAHALGLKPPIEVLKVILQITESGGSKDGRDERKAWIDEFLSSRDGGA
ncbi:hypothetical protein RUND412_004273 [Rhizina undulata]